MSFRCHLHLPQSKNVSMPDELPHVQCYQMSTFAEKKSCNYLNVLNIFIIHSNIRKSKTIH